MASKVILGDELLFPSKYLCHADLAGADLTLTIASIGKQELVMKGGGKKTKPVIAFRDHPKEFVLNVTNAESIAHLYGVRAEGWIGKRVTFFPTKAKFGKDMVDAIRVRERAPSDAAPASAPAPKQAEWTDDELRQIDAWKDKLEVDELTEEMLNGDFIKWFREIKPGDRVRGPIWTMVVDAAAKFSIAFDAAAKKFVRNATT
jgi:hypothetical protein